MSKRTKKSVGTSKRKKRVNYRKKTLRNRKTKRGYIGGKGSDDEEETGIEKLNLNVNAEPEVDTCTI